MAVTDQGILKPAQLTPAQLAARVQALTGTPADWVARVRLDPEGRWYEQIHMDDSYELWLISWLPGQSTGFHDHGISAGAFGVVWGELDEYLARGRGAAAREAGTNRVTGGVIRSFGQHYVHDVRNTSESSVAVSVHAYSPPLSQMTRYKLTEGGLVVAGAEGTSDW
ncbi:MAG TPA: cysteine dioxygenase family protein [Trebonia sp.]|jgi:predicted metal-dependent enzyme (double-stranded beta helix superfamily)